MVEIHNFQCWRQVLYKQNDVLSQRIVQFSMIHKAVVVVKGSPNIVRLFGLNIVLWFWSFYRFERPIVFILKYIVSYSTFEYRNISNNFDSLGFINKFYNCILQMFIIINFNSLFLVVMCPREVFLRSKVFIQPISCLLRGVLASGTAL